MRTSIRSEARAPAVRGMLERAGAKGTGRLEFVQADLLADAGWAEAAAGCDYVLHVASPLQIEEPADENDLIKPARAGTLRVLRAARDGVVKRVVMTSSFAAIGYGHDARQTAFTEADWTDPARAKGAYVRSKTLAERAAWDFVAAEGGQLELTTVNPTIILGPLLDADSSASVELVKAMLQGKMPALPQLRTGIVDVRDVVDLHLAAMTHPAAAGERFLCVSGDFLPLAEIARTLKSGMGRQARRVSTRVLPNWLVRLAGRFSATARQAGGPELGQMRDASSAKAQHLLGWSPRPPQEAILATGESLVRLGLVRP